MPHSGLSSQAILGDNRVRSIAYLLKKSLLLLTSALLFACALGAKASTYEAICGSSKCVISLSKERINTPNGIIPTSRVSNWGGGGKSESDLIMGASATYLLGPIGLIGFAAKTHDYNYSLTGYDLRGKRISVRIRFLNKRPAMKFIEEMVEFTRLSMSETRTAKDIKSLEAKMRHDNVKWVGDLPLGTLDQDLKSELNSSPLHSSMQRNQKNGCWTDKLKKSPNFAAWAEKNPSLAIKYKSEFNDC